MFARHPFRDQRRPNIGPLLSSTLQCVAVRRERTVNRIDLQRPHAGTNEEDGGHGSEIYTLLRCLEEALGSVYGGTMKQNKCGEFFLFF